MPLVNELRIFLHEVIQLLRVHCFNVCFGEPLSMLLQKFVLPFCPFPIHYPIHQPETSVTLRTMKFWWVWGNKVELAGPSTTIQKAVFKITTECEKLLRTLETLRSEIAFLHIQLHSPATDGASVLS